MTHLLREPNPWTAPCGAEVRDATDAGPGDAITASLARITCKRCRRIYRTPMLPGVEGWRL